MKLLDGSHREDRDGRPLATAVGVPVKPEWLGEIAAKVWDETVAELSEINGFLAPVDAGALAIYCHAWQEFHAARELIKRDGLCVKGREGVLVRHPALMVKKHAQDTIASIGAKFGLSPTSRASLAIDAVNVVAGVRRRNQHFQSDEAEFEDLIR
jgi:P27 family predicted phage terminase small subunit